jgi:hypothetical protein
MALLKRIVSASINSKTKLHTSAQHRPAIPLPHRRLKLMSVPFGSVPLSFAYYYFLRLPAAGS